MIQLEKFVGGGVVVVVVGWLTPTTYIQLAGAGSKIGQSYIGLLLDERCYLYEGQLKTDSVCSGMGILIIKNKKIVN